MKFEAHSIESFTRYLGENGYTRSMLERVQDTIFISINDSKSKPLLSRATNIKVFHFDDIRWEDPEVWKNSIFWKHFTKEMAQEILEFVDSNKSKVACIIHCHAGLSRSVAIAEFLTKYTEGTLWYSKVEGFATLVHEEWWKTKQGVLYLINPWIFKLMETATTKNTK